MSDDPQLLAIAEEAAVAMVAHYQRQGEGQKPLVERRSVYILEGCACEQQGASRRYHVHWFTPAGWDRWHATHRVTVVARYPL
jgi:hypothetical protein